MYLFTDLRDPACRTPARDRDRTCLPRPPTRDLGTAHHPPQMQEARIRHETAVNAIKTRIRPPLLNGRSCFRSGGAIFASILTTLRAS